MIWNPILLCGLALSVKAPIVRVFPMHINSTGEWLDDERHGHGEYLYKNGDHYVGRWRHHVRHGQGKYTYKSAEVQYDGDWNEGHRASDDDHIVKTEHVATATPSNLSTGMQCVHRYIQAYR